MARSHRAREIFRLFFFSLQREGAELACFSSLGAELRAAIRRSERTAFLVMEYSYLLE